MLCRQFIGGDPAYDSEINAAANYLMDHERNAAGPRGGHGGQKDVLVSDLYYTYYSVLAMFQMGGEYWVQWNKMFRDPLVALQEQKNILDGKGRFIRGSWDPADTTWGMQGGRVFSTAMAILSLEVVLPLSARLSGCELGRSSLRPQTAAAGIPTDEHRSQEFEENRMSTVLVVEDDKNQQLLLREELEDEGYQVRQAFNAWEALGMVRKQTPDLVVLDIGLPGMDGVELLGKLLSVNRQLPVVLYSGYSSYQDDFMTWAADAYVLKRADLTELKEAIHSVLKTHEPSRPRLEPAAC